MKAGRPLVGALAGAVLTALAALAAVGTLAPTAGAQSVAPEGHHFHNGSTLPLEDEGDGRELLRRLQAALDRSEPDDAAAVLRALRADPRVLLLPFGQRTHMAALDLAARLVAASGEGPVRERVLEEARAAIAEARRTRDLATLLDHATRGSALSSAGEAALDAARLEFESGAFWEAAVLASRASGLAGAAELEAAARRHLPPPAAPPSAAPVWERQGSVLLDLPSPRGTVDRNDEIFMPPAAVDAGQDRIAILDDGGLSLIARGDGTALIDRGRWLDEQLVRFRAGLGAPAPLRFQMARDRDRLFVPFNTLGDRGWKLWSSTQIAHLLAVDLAAGARTLWSAGAEAGTWPSAAFGPPLPVGSRVCALVFRSALDTEVSLACFAQSDGRRLFEVPLVAGAAVPRYASRQSRTDVGNVDKRAREGPPAERQGLIYACTGYGVVAVVDSLTGWLRHTFRYDRIFSQEPGEFDPAFLYETGGWSEEPVRLWGDRVVVAPGDSRFLYILAAEPGPAGQLALDDPVERLDRRFIVDLQPDPAGGASPAMLLSRRTGEGWGLVRLAPGGAVSAASPPLEPPLAFTGRPLALDARVLVPTNAGLLSYSAEDLAAPAVLVGNNEDVPRYVSAVHALDEGFVTFSPLVQPSDVDGAEPEIAWVARWYRARR